MTTDKRNIRQKLAEYLGELISVYHRFRGCDIGRNVRISKSAILDRSNPKGIHIGNNVRVLIEAMLIAHDYECEALKGYKMNSDIYIGNNCVIGGRAMILPGVHIGSNVYVAAGCIVTHSLPCNCMAAGNPARIIRIGTIISDNGQILDKGEKVKTKV